MKNLKHILKIIVLIFVICFPSKSCTESSNNVTEIACYKIQNNKIYYSDSQSTTKNITLDANPNNFMVLAVGEIPKTCYNSDIWAKDSLHVFYKSNVIKEADTKTFKPIALSYSKDKNFVFFENKIIIGAKPKTFTSLGDFYAKDDKYIYYKDKKQKLNANIESFGIIDGYFAKDSNTVYYITKVAIQKIDHADSKSFKEYELSKHGDYLSYRYYYDYKRVYIINIEKESDILIIENIDTNSFKPIKAYFTKDSFNIYYKNNKIQKADNSTFKVLNRNYSKDKNNIFYKYKILAKAEYSSFKTTKIENYDAKDSLNYYNKGEISQQQQ